MMAGTLSRRRPTLVIGAAGQVGQDLLRSLREHGDSVAAADLVAQAPARDLADLPWHRVDVTRAESVFDLLAQVRPRRVFHLAAILSARGEEDPQRTYAVNQTGTHHVLEACRRLGVEQLFFTSTIAVFGPGLPDPVPDDVPLHPTTMYGVTKASGEMLGAYYARRYGLDFRALRFPGLVSAVLPGGGTSDYALMMYYEGVRSGAYTAFCRPDTRIPLMYMPDAIRGLCMLADAPKETLTRRTYNIAAFSPRADEIAASVRKVLPGVRIDFEPDPVRQAILDSWPRALDDSAARRDFGFRPRYDLDAMTRDLVPRIRALVASPGAEGTRAHP